MKTNEDFEEWFEEEKRSLPLIAAMKPEFQPEYYLRKGYFANNDELIRARAEVLEWKQAYNGLMDDLAATATELNEIKNVDLHSAHERIKDLNVYIKDLKKDLDWTTMEIGQYESLDTFDIRDAIRVKYKLGE